MQKKILYIDMDNVLVERESILGAIEAVKILSPYYEIDILRSTSSGKKSATWADETWTGKDKDVTQGDFLIDHTKNGAGEFKGELIPFGSKQFPNWDAIIDYLLENVCHCFLPSYHGHSWSPEIILFGSDGVADVFIYTCVHCGRKWIEYYSEGPYEDTDRWFRALISEDDLKNMTTDKTMLYIHNQDWYKYGGSYHRHGEKFTRGKTSWSSFDTTHFRKECTMR